MKPFFLFILFFISMATSLAAQANSDCYKNLRGEGLTLLKKKNYRKAVDKFFAARYCPDKPVKDDLDDLIKKTQDQWVAALDQAVNNAKSAQKKTAAALTKADSALALANNIIDAFYFYKDSFALAYKNNYYGFIDKKGKAVIDYKYNEALPFDNTGYARVKRTDISYLIDTKGVEYRLATELNQLDSNVVALDLRDRRLDTFPMIITENPQLKILLLSRNRLAGLPAEFGQLDQLQYLDLSVNQLTSLPESIGELDSLRVLDLSYSDMKLKSVPATIGKLQNLQVLDLTASGLRSLPESIGNLRNLQSLILTYTPLTNFPEAISKLSRLQNLNLHRTGLRSLPVSIGELRNLQNLNLSHNKLKQLPESIGELSNLQTLEVFENELTSLPESIGQLKRLQKLVLYANPLTSLPESMGQMMSLQTLSISGSPLTSLPASIVQLSNLQKLYLSDNQIKNLPEKIGQLSKLRALSLSGNLLTSLPASIGALKQLQELDLLGNYLTDLPISIGQLTNLQKLDLSGNAIQKEALQKLPPAFYVENLLQYAQTFSYQENYISALSFYQTLATQKISQATKQDAAAACSNITFRLLFIKEFKLALKAGLLAQQFDTKNTNLYTNLPLAYLFNNEFEKAKAIYTAYKDKMYDVEKSYKMVFLQDFFELEAADITHPDIAKIRALLKD